MSKKIPAVFRIFKLPQPRGFLVPPRYYNPDKERIDKRYKEIRADLKAGKNISSRSTDNEKSIFGSARRQRKMANIRLLIILLLLCSLFYIVFTYLNKFETVG